MTSSKKLSTLSRVQMRSYTHLPVKRPDVERCLSFVREARRRSPAVDEAETPAGEPTREASPNPYE